MGREVWAGKGFGQGGGSGRGRKSIAGGGRGSKTKVKKVNPATHSLFIHLFNPCAPGPVGTDTWIVK